jgi:hypothetical protein
VSAVPAEGVVALLLALLCIGAYAPALNNGFIADDFVILQRIEFLKTDPAYLFKVVPENFRATSYIVFGLFKAIAGYDARWFYPFTILLHTVNCVLFYKLLRSLDDKRYMPLTAAAMFAVFQAPQEAVMWLAAMNEGLQAFFILSSLLLWDKRQHFLSVICFSFALVSKESAVIMLLMLPLWQLARGRPPLPREYFGFFVPAAIFAFVFLYTVSTNFMLTSRSYVIGFQAPIVIAKTLFRLTWPWLFIVIAILLFNRVRPAIPRRELAAYAAWLAVPMLPYMFINYQHHMPSRQLYMASMVLVSLFARLLCEVRSKQLRRLFIAGFVIFNIQYLWYKKDPQFEERAVSTTQLIQELKQHAPSRVLLIDFPYPQIEIARAAALAAPGWQAELIDEGTKDSGCATCLILRWDPRSLRYVHYSGFSQRDGNGTQEAQEGHKKHNSGS